ncbi:hypothetical protein [uncultured Rhodoblastus sp.]|uniref:hypothetical protein n=1 Tax=uncultured Rhodoblastus sp. TaxID=543037 RepID=UPI0025F66ADA|nr:hypothetical protein [uncultured Rhodoblastus sp.]
MQDAMTRLGYRNRRLEVLRKTGAGLHRVVALDKATLLDLDAFWQKPATVIASAAKQSRDR